MHKIVCLFVLLLVLISSGCTGNKEKDEQKEDGQIFEEINQSLEIIHIYRVFNTENTGGWAVDFVDNNSRGFSSVNSLYYGTRIDVTYIPDGKESFSYLGKIPGYRGNEIIEHYKLIINESSIVSGATYNWYAFKQDHSTTTQVIS